ncbi:MAG: hypothetical protein ACLVCW_01545 [Campylobacter sp.]
MNCADAPLPAPSPTHHPTTLKVRVCGSRVYFMRFARVKILVKGEEMAAKFGVNVTISAEAARPIQVESTTPIGIAGYEEVLQNGLHFFMTTDKAIDAIETIYKEKKGKSESFKQGSIYRALKAIADQAVQTQIILSVFTRTDNNDDSDDITACKAAIEAFKNAKSATGYPSTHRTGVFGRGRDKIGA